MKKHLLSLVTAMRVLGVSAVSAAEERWVAETLTQSNRIVTWRFRDNPLS